MRMALAVWSCSKRAYEYVQKSNILLLPHPRTLYRKKKERRANNGLSIGLYSGLFDEFVSHKKDEKLIAHLLVDEMKLKSGIWFNLKDGTVVGFETHEGGVNIDKELKDILKDITKQKQTGDIERDKKDINESERTGLASYVNQWRLHAIFSETRNLSFYFSSGDLTGSKILQQFMGISSMLVLVDIIVCGLTLKAGENNAGLVRYLLSDNR